MKLKKGKLLITLITSGILTGIGGGIIYIYFSASERPRTPELLILGIVIFAIAVVFSIIFFRSDSY